MEIGFETKIVALNTGLRKDEQVWSSYFKANIMGRLYKKVAKIILNISKLFTYKLLFNLLPILFIKYYLLEIPND